MQHFSGVDSPAIVVREARAAEYDEVGELTVGVYRALHDGDLGDYEDDLLDVARRAAEATVLVAVDDGRAILGAVTLATHGSEYAEQSGPDEAVFRMLAVSSTARRRGVGEALVQDCIDRSRALRMRRLRLSTQPFMHDAHRLYERMGFGRTPDHDWAPRPGIDLITYALDL